MSTLPYIIPSAEDNFCFERKLHGRGLKCIAGTDEVGRGPLAGPVVAACVSLPIHGDPSPFLDSKKTSHSQRIKLSKLLIDSGATIGIGIVSHKRIDAINILQASLLAMKLAVFHHSAVKAKPDFLLVDGKFEVPLDISQQTLIKGESKSASIAAASIIAKIKRDSIMDNLHQRYPQYGFNSNKGYPTKLHREVLKNVGPCTIHRKSFKGVGQFDS